jgi:dUTP pyrophosphatase
MDLRAHLEAPVTLSPGARTLAPTGLYISLPKSYEAQIRPRSGLAWKKGLTVLNTPGTIDADYRGEIGVVLVNHSQADYVINDGDRIAQMIVARYETVEWEPVEMLDETERGAGGFGHSDVKERIKKYLEENKLPITDFKQCMPKFLGIETASDFIKMHGFIEKPEAKVKNPQQFLFINGNFTDNHKMQNAIFSIYEEKFPPKTAPSYFINLNIQSEDEDDICSFLEGRLRGMFNNYKRQLEKNQVFGDDPFASERELLYRALFDLRNDVNELKKHVLNNI